MKLSSKKLAVFTLLFTLCLGIVVTAVASSSMFFTVEAVDEDYINTIGDICYILHTDIETGKTDWKAHRQCMRDAILP